MALVYCSTAGCQHSVSYGTGIYNYLIKSHLELANINIEINNSNTFKCRVFALMGRFQLGLIYLYCPPSFHITVVVSVL